MQRVLYLSMFIIGLILVSCAKEVDEDLNPMNDCDTEAVSFQDDVLPIFNSNCNVCHGAASNFGGITLDNFEDTKTVVDIGRLIGAIKRTDGFSPMPKNAGKLSDCNIDKIAAWVADGAPNN